MRTLREILAALVDVVAELEGASVPLGKSSAPIRTPQDKLLARRLDRIACSLADTIGGEP